MDRTIILKLCPKLKENVAQPTQFNKMNVSCALQILNNAASIVTYYISQNIFDKKHETTAWFLRLIHKWFTIMTSRYYKYALCMQNMEEKTATVLHLSRTLLTVKPFIFVSNLPIDFRTKMAANRGILPI